MSVTLFKQNSAEDYVLRGFSQSEILDFTGVDVGYHGNALKASLKGIDRYAYKILYVQTTCSSDTILDTLDKYSKGLDKESVLRCLGIAGANIVKLKQLFLSLGYAEKFAAADKAQRKLHMKNGTIAKYGTDNVFKLSEFQEKAGDTREKRYGGRYTLSSDSSLADDARAMFTEHMKDDSFRSAVDAKKKATNEERYGDTCVMNNDDVLAKYHATCMERYGVSCYARTADFRRKMNNVTSMRIQDGVFSSSSSEETLYILLLNCFDESDIIRQYMSDVYDYACDFYIKSRNMYVELNATWLHGGHWYDADSTYDNSVLLKWQKKNTAYYDNAIATWTKRDVHKREMAKKNALNYVVFWDANLSDAMLWIAMGCPDGQDWLQEYSWLPERSLAVNFSYPKIDVCNNRSVRAAVKAANGHVFYDNAINLWDANPYVLCYGTLQARLYFNRYKYLGKLPYDLSDIEILRGLSISGLYRGYSVFDNTGMVDLIKRYDVKSIYDPCAGWGERLLTSGLLGVKYHGCDINARLFGGYDSLINHYDLQDCNVHLGDSATYDMCQHHHDCVFTCPPYESVEHYTTVGAENFSHEDFLKWWKEVVLHSISDMTRIFAYQINTRFKDDMNRILLDLGWTLTEQIPVGKNAVSHLSKRNGKKEKKNWDEIQVFVRK